MRGLGALIGAFFGDMVEAVLTKPRQVGIEMKVGEDCPGEWVAAAVKDMREKKPLNRAAVEKILWANGLRLDGDTIRPAVQAPPAPEVKA